jgi:hypothetical protein
MDTVGSGAWQVTRLSEALCPFPFVDRVGHSCPSQAMIASSTQDGERYKSDAYRATESYIYDEADWYVFAAAKHHVTKEHDRFLPFCFAVYSA